MSSVARWVRFGRVGSQALRDELASIQRDDPLAPATVVVARSPVGAELRRLLASGALAPSPGGGGLVNVRFTTLRRLADQLGGVSLARAGRRPVAGASLRAAVEGALARAPADGSLLVPLREHEGTVAALARAYGELRDVPAADRALLAAQSPRAREVVALVDEIGRSLARWYDDRDLTEAAIQAIAADPAAARALLGAVVVHQPLAWSASDQRLVDALAEVVPVTVLLAHTGEPAADADVRSIAAHLGLAPPPASDGAPAGGTGPSTTVRSAPSPDAEVLLTVRALFDRRVAGVPFDRMAVVHPGLDPYPRLLHETLAQAGVPVTGPSVRPLASTLVGRTLLGALALPERDWRRDDVMAWLAGAPVLDPATGGEPVPATSWDEVSRDAGITAGLATWHERLDAALARATRVLDELAEEAASAVGDGRQAAPDAGRDDAAGDPADRDASLDARRRWAERVEARREAIVGLRTFVDGLVATLAPDPAPRRWADWSAWASDLLDRYLGPPDTWIGWPAVEVDAATSIGDAIARLSGLDDLAPRPDRAAFTRALGAELHAPAPALAATGAGVLVGPPSAAVGLDLDVVFLVGLTERACPRLPADDGLLPDHERAVLGDLLPARRDRAAARARRDHLALLAGATDVVLSYARGDQRTGREQRPSRWLLDAVGELEGVDRRVFSRDLPALAARPERPHGFELVPSHLAAVRHDGEPASLGDRDLRSLLDWRDRTGALDGHPLLVDDAVLRLGSTTRRERRSRRFTRFDGRVAPASVRSPVSAGALSPTSLQHYALCPRRYLLANVLRLREVDKPEEILRISAMDRGSLVHEVLERFLASSLAAPRDERIRPGTPWSAADHARLDELTDAVCAEYERRGLTGRPLLWDVDRRAIRRDVHSFLRADDRYRASAGAVPDRVEFEFGPDRGRPVTVDLPSGRRLDFKGVADRVDVADDGTVVVLDYKTGGDRGYEDLEHDPVARGRLLQLPIYGLAARRHIGAGPVRAAYWFVSERGGFEQRGYDLDDARLDRFREVLDVVVDGIEAGHFPANPGERNYFGFEHCTYCEFQRVCPRDRDQAWTRVKAAPALEPYVRLAEGRDDEPLVDAGDRLDLQIGAGPDLGLVGGRASLPDGPAAPGEPSAPDDGSGS